MTFMKRMVSVACAATSCAAAAATLPLPDGEATAIARRTLAKMTLEEKVSLCGLCATMYLNKIPRVGIDREWSFNDCGHCMKPEHNRDQWGYIGGVDDRSTSLPCPSALAATWNPSLATRHGHVMGEQMRSRDKSQMLGPGINIMRNPLGGRNWEYMSEDPLVAAKMVAPLVKAAQSHGLACTPKHFCLNSQEMHRFDTCSTVDDRALHEIYLPAFKAVIQEGGSLSLMTAYNRYNGIFCSENPYLQKGLLREQWGFLGTIVTDWGGQHSCDNAVLNGGGFEANHGRGVTYLTDFYGTKGDDKFPLATAVKAGRIPAAQVDEMALRVLYVMAKTGFLTGQQEKGERLTKKHQKTAREIGAEAIVLAKNAKGVLPLDKSVTQRLVVFGEVAKTEVAHLGSSCECHPLYEISFLKGLEEYLGKGTRIDYFPLGGEAGDDLPMPIDDLLLETYDASGKDAFAVRSWAYTQTRKGKVIKRDFVKKTEGDYDYNCSQPGLGPADQGDDLEWRAKVKAPESGEYEFLVLQANYSVAGIAVDGKDLLKEQPGRRKALATLEKGKVYEIVFSFRMGEWKNFCKFGWIVPSARKSSPEVVRQAVKEADAVLVFTGTTMGFGQAKETEGGDRPNMLASPGHDAAIAEILAMGNPKTVVISRTGSPIEMPWIDKVDTMLTMSYLGQEAGRPFAKTLFGALNPSGKMTWTWPRTFADTPVGHFGARAYNATNSVYLESFYVGYRWYEKRGIPVVFPFGHGLSYTTFEYGAASVTNRGGSFLVSVPVKNTGAVAGKEVVQLYVAPAATEVERCVKELKGFTKVSLKPGETKTVKITVRERDFAYWDALLHRWRTPKGTYGLLIGSSSADIRAKASVEVAKERTFDDR